MDVGLIATTAGLSLLVGGLGGGVIGDHFAKRQESRTKGTADGNWRGDRRIDSYSKLDNDLVTVMKCAQACLSGSDRAAAVAPQDHFSPDGAYYELYAELAPVASATVLKGFHSLDQPRRSLGVAISEMRELGERRRDGFVDPEDSKIMIGARTNRDVCVAMIMREASELIEQTRHELGTEIP